MAGKAAGKPRTLGQARKLADSFEMRLTPKAGFDWSRVTWGRPDSSRSALCSYCSASVPEDSVPLILWQRYGYAAQFCDECQRKWWGVESYPEPKMET
jgi:hypothetical protein